MSPPPENTMPSSRAKTSRIDSSLRIGGSIKGTPPDSSMALMYTWFNAKIAVCGGLIFLDSFAVIPMSGFFMLRLESASPPGLPGLIHFDEELAIAHDGFAIEPQAEVAAYAIDVGAGVPGLAGMFIVGMTKSHVEAGDFFVLQNVADDIGHGRVGADGILADTVAVLIGADVSREFIEQFFIRAVQMADARILD